jgi:hypothetical protein
MTTTAEIAEAIAELEAYDAPAAEAVRELVRAVLDLDENS